MTSKHRRDFRVTSIKAFAPDTDNRIIFVGDGFHLHVAGEVVADCASAKRLSDYAFEEGARSVRHDYDGRLSDGEM